jgi:LmbE family N-acetylglucosaminyl deacetylase
MVRHNIAIAITPDSGGIDAHRDHQAVSRATIWAARGVQLLGKRVAVWTLSSTGQGEVVLPVDPASKLRAIAAHTSQFSLSHLDTSKLERGFDRSLIPADLAQYGELLDGQETYDRVRLWESLGQQLLGRLRLPKKTTSDTTTDALY